MKTLIEEALEVGKGVLRLAPTWVGRPFCVPGRRLKLHPDDYYAKGVANGGIDERWFASTVSTDSGSGQSGDEGLSYIVHNNEKVSLLDAVALLKGEIVGDRLWNKYKMWPAYSKFFDNQGPLPHHVHQRQEHASHVNKSGKPEMYYFPTQLNNHGGEFPFTFFGLIPGTSKEQLRICMQNFEKGDNGILDISQSYKLIPGTGWDVPAGVLHAPGSLLTYEPQFASDVFAMYQSVLYGGDTIEPNLLWKDVPDSNIGDIEYLINILDWDINIDSNFYNNRFMKPLKVKGIEDKCYDEKWVCYKSWAASAKELSVPPGETVKVVDNAAYGFILLQGYGTINSMPLETPSQIRYGQLTYDEYFVVDSAAKEGVTITNISHSEPLVMLKHFGPENPDLIL